MPDALVTFICTSFKKAMLLKNKKIFPRCIVEMFWTSESPDKSSQRYKKKSLLKTGSVLISLLNLQSNLIYKSYQLHKIWTVYMVTDVKWNYLPMKTIHMFLVLLLNKIILQWQNFPQSLLPWHKVGFQTSTPKIHFKRIRKHTKDEKNINRVKVANGKFKI